jgi:hypothetical protein
MTYIVMLLLLRKLRSDSMTFCALEKVSETDDSQEKAPGTTMSWR